MASGGARYSAASLWMKLEVQLVSPALVTRPLKHGEFLAGKILLKFVEFEGDGIPLADDGLDLREAEAFMRHEPMQTADEFEGRSYANWRKETSALDRCHKHLQRPFLECLAASCCNAHLSDLHTDDVAHD
jgi:hypothetical protein